MYERGSIPSGDHLPLVIPPGSTVLAIWNGISVRKPSTKWPPTEVPEHSSPRGPFLILSSIVLTIFEHPSLSTSSGSISWNTCFISESSVSLSGLLLIHELGRFGMVSLGGPGFISPISKIL